MSVNRAANISLVFAIAAIVAASISAYYCLRGDRSKSYTEPLAGAIDKQKECEKCERLAERMSRKERSYDTFLHQVVVDGTDYSVSETRYEDNGEQEYVVSRGRRQWILKSSNPDETFVFLTNREEPKVEQNETLGLIRIYTEQGKHIATLSGRSHFMLRADVEWERVVDEDEKQAAIDAIKGQQ